MPNTADIQPISLKTTVCGNCNQRTCCYHYRVTMTGYDVWRIAKTLDLTSSRFVTYAKAIQGNDETFVLDQSGERYELVLQKTIDERRYGGCTFLVSTNDGAHRCGLGELRPCQCTIYPAYCEDGIVHVINDPQGCWRVWSVCDLEIEEEYQRSQEYESQKMEYQEVLASWNQRVWSKTNRQFNFSDFCNHLENQYAILYADS
ncbi:MAG: YkgJ family cysteine cluster protein [Deltaproteobacteria bacterium]|nr:YkgJ family cysteine cluster protein [Deltaproteobacteria bacterium]